MSVCAEQNIFKNNHFSQGKVICDQSSQNVSKSMGKRDYLQQILLWGNRYRQRKVLATLDERMLADIGYSSKQVSDEITKPFWK